MKDAIGTCTLILCIYIAGAATVIIAERFAVIPGVCVISEEALEIIGGSTRK